MASVVSRTLSRPAAASRARARERINAQNIDYTRRAQRLTFAAWSLRARACEDAAASCSQSVGLIVERCGACRCPQRLKIARLVARRQMSSFRLVVMMDDNSETAVIEGGRSRRTARQWFKKYFFDGKQRAARSSIQRLACRSKTGQLARDRKFRAARQQTRR